MTPTTQEESNRRNAELSTGPTSAEGKAISAKNSLKHGLFSKEVLMPGENAEEFEGLRDSLRSELKPVAGLESALVDRIIGLIWRLRRLTTIETAILTYRYFDILAEEAGRRADSFTEKIYFFEPPEGYFDEVVATNPEEYKNASKERRAYEAEKRSDLARTGEVFVRDSGRENAFSKLSRSETSLERSLLRTIHEFQRLKASREGKEVAVPLAIDIDITGAESLAAARPN